MRVHSWNNMNKSKNRDDYFRCSICGGLFETKECYLDPIKGYMCPNGCEESYVQPKYEKPTIDD